MAKDSLMPHKIYQKNPDFVTRVINEEIVLVPVKRKAVDLDRFFVLNQTGRVIWELIDGQRNLDQIKQSLIEEFEVSESKTEADLTKFIQELKEIEGITEISKPC